MNKPMKSDRVKGLFYVVIFVVLFLTAITVLNPTITGFDVFSSGYYAVTSLQINSTYGTNLTGENITAYWSTNYTGEQINITDWRFNGKSLAVLNLPFEYDGLGATGGVGQTEDYSVYASNATLNGAASVSYTQSNSHTGGAYYFQNQVNHPYFSIPDSPDLVFGNKTTLMAWVFWTGGSGGYQPIIEKGTFSTADGEFAFSINPSGNPGQLDYIWQTKDGNGGEAFTVAALPRNSLKHIAVVRNGTNLNFYIDGASVAISVQGGSLTGSPFKNTASSVYVGGVPIGSSEHFTGFIDDVRMYNVSLTQKQIQQIVAGRDDLLLSSTAKNGEWQLALTVNNLSATAPTGNFDYRISNTVKISNFNCYDADVDGFNSTSQCGVIDCDDTNSNIRPIKSTEVLNENIQFCNSTSSLVTGIRINSSDIQIDCNRTVINGVGINVGMNITNLHNVTIKGCGINGYDRAFSFINASNITLENNTAISNIPLFIKGGRNNNIINNTFAGDLANKDMVKFLNTNNNIFSGNIIKGEGDMGVRYALVLQTSSNNNITHNFINCSPSVNNLGIYVHTNSNNTLIKNNEIIAQGPISYGILISTGSRETNIINNSVTTFAPTISPGIYIHYSSHDNYIINNTINSSTDGELTFAGCSSNNTAVNNVFLKRNVKDILTADHCNNTLIFSKNQNKLSFTSKVINVSETNNFFINNSLVSINSSEETTLNTSASISFNVPSCDYDLFISSKFTTNLSLAETNAQQCTSCSNKVCANNIMNFTTSHFSTILALPPIIPPPSTPPATREATTTTHTTSSSFAPCAGKFECSEWGVCESETQTRTCKDAQRCYKDKTETRSCSIAVPIVEQPAAVLEQSPVSQKPVSSIDTTINYLKSNLIFIFGAFGVLILLVSLLFVVERVSSPVHRFRKEFDVIATRRIVDKAKSIAFKDKKLAIRIYNNAVRAYQILDDKKKKLFEKELKELKRNLRSP